IVDQRVNVGKCAVPMEGCGREKPATHCGRPARGGAVPFTKPPGMAVVSALGMARHARDTCRGRRMEQRVATRARRSRKWCFSSGRGVGLEGEGLLLDDNDR